MTTASVDAAAKGSTIDGVLVTAGVITAGATLRIDITVTNDTTPGLANCVGVIGL
ncbi:hypothetical protein TSUD_62460 [Trifolium subterraneum]|uniref:Uncharacterized protein n=1 Tax=Trifolium subterraneum TaxID=3900 RepID=A0A2Z6MD06_TRISU|nr:hypothetical protein TSUD_62460 [Trifolium subterraneum]